MKRKQLLFLITSLLCLLFVGNVMASAATENYIDMKGTVPIYEKETTVRFMWKVIEGCEYTYSITDVETNKKVKYVRTLSNKGYMPKEKTKLKATYRVNVKGIDKEGQIVDEYKYYFHIGEISTDPVAVKELDNGLHKISQYILFSTENRIAVMSSGASNAALWKTETGGIIYISADGVIEIVDISFEEESSPPPDYTTDQ